MAKKKATKKKVSKKKVVKKSTNPVGRPTKFNDGQLMLIKYMAKQGKTDKQISEELGITQRTFTNWKKDHEKYFLPLRDWKDEADAEIERCLYEKAKGYTVKETKVFCHEGMVITEDIDKHLPPDTSSMIFWLKNRQPDKWRDRREVEATNVNMSIEEFIQQSKKDDK